MTRRVNVYDNGGVVARVPYSNNLDMWNGSNFQSGGTGRHLGVARISGGKYEGRFALIHGTNWQGESDSAEVVSNEDALQAILKAEMDELFDKDDFQELRTLAEEQGLL